MADFKSKLPDFKEITSMAGKLFKDVKTSICEIVADYKKNHSSAASAKPSKKSPEKKAAGPKPTTEKKTEDKDN